MQFCVSDGRFHSFDRILWFVLRTKTSLLLARVSSFSAPRQNIMEHGFSSTLFAEEDWTLISFPHVSGENEVLEECAVVESRDICRLVARLIWLVG